MMHPPALSHRASKHGSEKPRLQSVPSGAGLPPVQTPPLHVVLSVHGEKSSQGVPFGWWRSGHAVETPSQKSSASQFPLSEKPHCVPFGCSAQWSVQQRGKLSVETPLAAASSQLWSSPGSRVPLPQRVAKKVRLNEQVTVPEML